MNSTCKQHYADLLERIQGGGQIDPAGAGAAQEHLASCAACAAALNRWSAQAKALEGLSRSSAPDELDVLVARALAPEGRAERLGRAVASLERRAAHDDLEAVVLGGGDLPQRESALRAPTVLDRLVGEELANPLATQARRAVGRLPRLRAPAELEVLVERELAAPAASSSSDTGRGRLLRMRPRQWTGTGTRMGMGVAAALILWFAGQGHGPTAPIDNDDYGFEIRRMDDLAGLDPQARNLLDGLTGGLLTAEDGR
ncbi:MAG: hypothetical protein QF599_12880 [Planctomycetota bacterium]|nr:hypothetical protein [Planctomycetota bacterium]MDP6956857.1 hypothetical protein [Planctomycetota bacterium]